MGLSDVKVFQKTVLAYRGVLCGLLAFRSAVLAVVVRHSLEKLRERLLISANKTASVNPSRISEINRNAVRNSGGDMPRSKGKPASNPRTAALVE